MTDAATEAGPILSVPLWQRPLGWIVGGAAFLVLLAIVIIIAVATHGPQTFTVKGGLVIVDSSVIPTGTKTCAATGGYEDIDKGTSVVITDAAGKTIALGKLDEGRSIPDANDECAFFFTVKNVPDGQKFYGIEVSHRGNVKYSLKEMKKGPVLSLGTG